MVVLCDVCVFISFWQCDLGCCIRLLSVWCFVRVFVAWDAGGWPWYRVAHCLRTLLQSHLFVPPHYSTPSVPAPTLPAPQGSLLLSLLFSVFSFSTYAPLALPPCSVPLQWPVCACMELDAARLLFTTLLPTVCCEDVFLFELYKHVFKVINAVYGRITFDWTAPALRGRSVSRAESLNTPATGNSVSNGSWHPHMSWGMDTGSFCFRPLPPAVLL